MLMDKQMLEDLPNWEKEYLSMNPEITKRQRELLEGSKIKSQEGMLYGTMYADWKVRKGYE